MRAPAPQQASPSLSEWLRPLALAAMVGCVVLAVGEAILVLAPGWNTGLLLAACVLVAVEASYGYRVIQEQHLSGGELLRFRAIEYGFFFVLLKLGGLIGRADLSFLNPANWPSDLTGILEAVFDLQTTANFFIVVFVSMAVHDTLHDLDRLGEPPEQHSQYTPPLESLTLRFFVGGGILLLAAGLARVRPGELLDPARDSLPGLVLNVLVYFVLGLLLLGQVRYATLRGMWHNSGIKVAAELPGRWLRYSLAFIAAAGLVAFALPTGYTSGALGLLGTLVFWIVIALWFLVALLFNLILFPVLSSIFWLMERVFGPLRGDQIRPPPPVLPPLQPPTPQSLPEWFQSVQTIVVWVLIAAMVLYVLLTYLRERPQIMDALKKIGPAQLLRRWWAAFRTRVSGLAEIVGARLTSDWLERLAARRPAAALTRLFRPGRESPRTQIVYYYLSLLRRAGEQGFPRRAGQTPLEYRVTLEAHLPEVQPEVRQLTSAFIEARYSAHPIEPDQAEAARALWARLRTALNALRQKRRKPK